MLKYILYSLLFIGVVIGIIVLLTPSKKKLCEGEKCCSLANKKNYYCYCSVKCGPREIGAEAGDNPSYAYPVDGAGNEVTTYGKKCFCQKTETRNDSAMFIPNKCYTNG